VEGAAEDSVGGVAEGDRKVEEAVNGPGSAGQREMRQAFLDFLSSTDVGRQVPPLEVSDARSEVSSGSCGITGSGKKGDGQRQRSWVPQGSWVSERSHRCSCHATLYGICRRGVGGGVRFLCALLCPFLASFPWCALHFLGAGLGGTKGELAKCRHCVDSGWKNG
jgi:hypothetical protein